MISTAYPSRSGSGGSSHHIRPPLGSWRLFGVLVLAFAFFLSQGRSGSSNDTKLNISTISILSGRDLVQEAEAATSSDAFEKAEKTSRESTEATDVAAAAAAELVDTLDAAREAADQLRRVAARAAHKKRVADRAAAVAAYHAKKTKTPSAGSGSSEIAIARERKVQLQDGSEASFSVFGRSDEDVSVFVLPYNTQQKKFTLIEEYHPGPNQKMMGLVAGMFEAKHGGSAEKAAIWELSEEARLKMGKQSQLLHLAPQAAKGGFSQDKYSSAHFQPFLALDCDPDERPRPRDREENIQIHSDISPDDLRTMIVKGQLNMPSTAFAIMGLEVLEKKGLL